MEGRKTPAIGINLRDAYVGTGVSHPKNGQHLKETPVRAHLPHGINWRARTGVFRR